MEWLYHSPHRPKRQLWHQGFGNQIAWGRSRPEPEDDPSRHAVQPPDCLCAFGDPLCRLFGRAFALECLNQIAVAQDAHQLIALDHRQPANLFPLHLPSNRIRTSRLPPNCGNEPAVLPPHDLRHIQHCAVWMSRRDRPGHRFSNFHCCLLLLPQVSFGQWSADLPSR